MIAKDTKAGMQMRGGSVDASLGILDLLLSRCSVAPKTLRAPGPSREELSTLVAAALTAPGRDGPRPYRFIAIQGKGRLQLAQACLEIRKRSNPRTSAQELARSWRKTMRAPTLVGIVARLVHDHPRVPAHEQYVTVGAAIQGILIACHALGYGAIVLSGQRSRASLVHRLLGLAENEEIIGFISIGTSAKKVNPKRRPSPAEYLELWRGSSSSELA